MNPLLQSLTIPDIWQQEAVRALRDGRDVVVHAPTGAGKTYVFELLYPQLKAQAVFTVPTRALANDKLAEWRARGWDVGIATGDIAERLDAKVVVATLETQKGRFLRREGPSVLVIDEYQMIGDPVRGVNYELAIALAPPETQLLLLSGSVANPHDLVAWLQRIGRDAVLVSHEERPVPLEEVDLLALPNRASNLRGWWSRVTANALRADLGPILLFAPRRNAAEDLATQLASSLPPAEPLRMTAEQEALAGTRLAKLLKARVAYHHSGLSYAQRAELVEPLAKRGELRVVVATMGLAAGINFSMRSVAITGTRYMAGPFERSVQPDELLQMYGRAGRRGLDETGYALVTEQPPRLLDARARHLRRSNQVDWPTLIAVMHGAVVANEAQAESAGSPIVTPFQAALDLNERLFTTQKVPLGVEHSLSTGAMPCGLWVDMERARFARRGIVEILNGDGEWEPRGPQIEKRPLEEAWIWEPVRPPKGTADPGDLPAPAELPVEVVLAATSIPGAPEIAHETPRGRWRLALSLSRTLDGIGVGSLIRLESKAGPRLFGRELILGTRRPDGTLSLSPWMKRKLGTSRMDLPRLQAEVIDRLPALTAGGRLVNLFPRNEQLVAHLSYGDRPMDTWVDSKGRPLVAPPERRELPEPCRCGWAAVNGSASPAHGEAHPCPQLPWCLGVEITASPAHAWRRLGLIETDGRPTRRGIIFSFFQHGEGLAFAAALEDVSYDLEELVFDLANLRAGPRFSGDESPYSGRLAILCQQTYARADLTGYLEMGVPGDYGAGASEVVREILRHGTPRQKLLTESLRMGDLERALVEWKSLLRHVTYAPDYPWDRWRALKSRAGAMLEEVEKR